MILPASCLISLLILAGSIIPAEVCPGLLLWFMIILVSSGILDRKIKFKICPIFDPEGAL
jgi:hypothetical protein